MSSSSVPSTDQSAATGSTSSAIGNSVTEQPSQRTLVDAQVQV